MVKKFAAIAVAGLCAGSAMSAVSIQTVAFGIVAPTGSSVIDFNNASSVATVGLPAGFTATATGIVGLFTGSHSGTAAAPMGDETQYLAIGNGSYTVKSTAGFSNFSFYWGSIDAGNQLDLLDVNGNSFFTLTGNNALMSSTANGDWWSSATNRTVMVSSDQRIFGARFSYAQPAFELDNITFGGVPEPATWAMMVGGFGFIGFALRNSRKQKSSITFA